MLALTLNDSDFPRILARIASENFPETAVLREASNLISSIDSRPPNPREAISVAKRAPTAKETLTASSDFAASDNAWLATLAVCWAAVRATLATFKLWLKPPIAPLAADKGPLIPAFKPSQPEFAAWQVGSVTRL